LQVKYNSIYADISLAAVFIFHSASVFQWHSQHV